MISISHSGDERGRGVPVPVAGRAELQDAHQGENSLRSPHQHIPNPTKPNPNIRCRPRSTWACCLPGWRSSSTMRAPSRGPPVRPFSFLFLFVVGSSMPLPFARFVFTHTHTYIHPTPKFTHPNPSKIQHTTTHRRPLPSPLPHDRPKDLHAHL